MAIEFALIYLVFFTTLSILGCLTVKDHAANRKLVKKIKKNKKRKVQDQLIHFFI
jgi:hypothetical protein